MDKTDTYSTKIDWVSLCSGIVFVFIGIVCIVFKLTGLNGVYTRELYVVIIIGILYDYIYKGATTFCFSEHGVEKCVFHIPIQKLKWDEIHRIQIHHVNNTGRYKYPKTCAVLLSAYFVNYPSSRNTFSESFHFSLFHLFHPRSATMVDYFDPDKLEEVVKQYSAIPVDHIHESFKD